MQVQNLNLVGKTYEEVNMIVRNLANFPEDVSWNSFSGYALKGIVPQENTGKFYDVIKFSYELCNQTYEFDESNRYFRNSNFLTGIFRWFGEEINAYVHNFNRVFLLNSYDELTNQKIIQVFEKMAACFRPCDVKLYSIIKDVHDGQRCRSTPFRRPYVALMVVNTM